MSRRSLRDVANARAAVRGVIVPAQRRGVTSSRVVTRRHRIGTVAAWVGLGTLAVAWVLLLVAVVWWLLP